MVHGLRRRRRKDNVNEKMLKCFEGLKSVLKPARNKQNPLLELLLCHSGDMREKDILSVCE
jgi:hypothetical protein